ncbi:hypothetical protein L1987_16119 [Smallanthus sonchifolius]|uniref:Uncharacterized protein n=1 Tax=Smallanthus sonchifolius TaxID=185202 RepID=A0ACB9J9Q5_9ASTR|nr:hypothetical protein L1987_16119 [Smallanthus sonchifolius]
MERFALWEARCMTKARQLGVSTPVLYALDTVSHTLTFECVEGPSIRDIFLEFGLQGVVEEKMDDIALHPLFVIYHPLYAISVCYLSFFICSRTRKAS